MLNKPQLIDAAIDIADGILSYRGFSQNALLQRKLDLKKTRLFGMSMWADLGDYAPFFYWLGEASKNEEYKEFAIKQAKLAAIEAEKQTVFSSNEAADFILGIALLYRLSRKEFLKDAAEKFYVRINRMISQDGFVPAYSSLGINSPFYASGYTGVFIEELCELFEVERTPNYIRIAETLAMPWINDEDFIKHGLFFVHFSGNSGRLFSIPLRLALGIDSNTAVLMKPNTNFISGITKLYCVSKSNILKNALLKWMDAVEKKVFSNGFFCSYFNSKANKAWNINLETNHAVIDALIEIYLATKNKKAIELAETCAQSWLAIQSKTGFIPNSPQKETAILSFDGIAPRKRLMNGEISRLDSQTDFAVVLPKLYCATDDKKYLNAAEKIIGGVLQYHKFNKGYCEFVDTNTHKKTGFVMQTKYQTLLLKALLCMDEVYRGKNILNDANIRSLIRDR